MKKLMNCIFLFVIAVLFIRCASSVSGLIIQEPLEGKSLLVGAVLVENDGIDELFQLKTSNIVVIIVSKYTENGKEQTEGYRIKTDKNGYFMIQNVHPGAYVLKGIEVDVGYTNRVFVTSMWKGDMQHYLRGSGIIDYIVRVWPPENPDRIINMNINYFMIDNAGRVYYENFKALKNTKLRLKNQRHTMANPESYFKENYPDLGWFE